MFSLTVLQSTTTSAIAGPARFSTPSGRDGYAAVAKGRERHRARITSALRSLETMNRYFRRLARFGKSFSERRSRGQMVNTQAEIFSPETPQDVSDVRAKSSRHRKKSADKWNQ
jgi:hypothetical protein